MIDVKHLTKWYGRVLAVDNISFEVAKGSVVGFLGPNGAGKSTTLKIMTCYMPPTRGSVTVDGLDVLSDSLEVRRRIGYMPESVPLYPEMRVGEYLRFRASLRDIPAKEQSAAVQRVGKRCWLSEPEDMTRRRLGDLSRGYKQRVGLAEVLLHDPPVLVLDEPTIGLDPGQIRAMRALITELGEDHTVILSSHILAEVEQTCSQIVIIQGGRLVAQGTPNELRQRVVGQGKVIAEIRGAESKQIAGAAGTLDNAARVDHSDHNGWTRLEVTTRGETDIRGDLYKLAHNNGWELRELRRATGSLEDFFVQVTYEQSMQQAG
ncbi:MAG: ATP-binding cassette domain-containing protein [Planctomycetes bacterium]|jgi:ABC-2 type transport system ATP-binding protein|nr:ATP-binding cassette domain-containing protein [Phycisphaerae bacterium]NBB95580.1 ATP-binding cassette domain-containing protein [Planctomycetota bacterium]